MELLEEEQGVVINKEKFINFNSSFKLLASKEMRNKHKSNDLEASRGTESFSSVVAQKKTSHKNQENSNKGKGRSLNFHTSKTDIVKSNKPDSFKKLENNNKDCKTVISAFPDNTRRERKNSNLSDNRLSPATYNKISPIKNNMRNSAQKKRSV
eukprot:CAMPEP_0170534040 /NCGR_PEP_ID=MMETSP0209-20121228/87764_1 /TAXON_ID=665100 ORGANISM="Litonotus pictus, Strain P1" /NCGR_SAMPLE_ID=MMETSP0209 /ASSEMBLY_ACC=CAM_ASM_000301 /LENGTH=153 /DNA_ID=CAMNT_0010832783 /DNA_START=1 /DNA_END=458 /DNA_ORIENTATION=+